MHVQRSMANVKRKQQNFVISVTILIGCFTRTFISLRESNSTPSGKVKEFTFGKLFRNPFTELALNFYTRKSLC